MLLSPQASAWAWLQRARPRPTPSTYNVIAAMFEQQKTELGLNVPRVCAVSLLTVAALVCFLLHGTAFFVLSGIGFAIMIVREVLNDRQRMRAIRQLAEKNGFTYLGSALPVGFPLRKTASRWARSIDRACVRGAGPKAMLIFDCDLGGGKGRIRRTVVALQGEPADFGYARFAPDLFTERVDGWTLVYCQRRLLEVPEIAELVREALGPQASADLQGESA